jgi:5-methylthioadenosine/S-adenosylhomocysteine deaminase
MEGQARVTVDLLISGGLIVTLDDAWTVIKDGALAVNGREIVAVGPSNELAQLYTGAEVLDASGHIVMPGLVNAHTHCATSLFRGLADDRPLKDWLERYIWPAEQTFIDPRTVRWATLLALVEQMRGGVTTCLDMYFFEEAVGQAAEQSGMRIVLGELLFDTAGPGKMSFDSALDETSRLFETYRDHSRITVSVQPHGAYTVSPENLTRAKAVADKYGMVLGLHASETMQEVIIVRNQTGYSPPALLAHLGLLDDRVILYHGVHLIEEEIELLAESGAGIVHCPEANLKLASGIAPLPDLLRAGVRVGLGTDGPASNNDFNMWGEMQMAAKIHRGTSGDPLAVTAREVVSMATRGGADLLGLGSLVGTLENGKRADIILISLDQPHLIPMYDVYSHLAYVVGREDVTTVIVDGHVVMKDRVLLSLDESEVLAQIRQIAKEISRWLAEQ